jgi:fatty acid desaturase
VTTFWKASPLDAIMLALSLGQLATTIALDLNWHEFSVGAWAANFAFLTFMMTYNIIIISHLFTHTPWFASPLLNGLASLINSANIGQSVQAYQLTHVRNHHRYNNDRKGENGRTEDLSSTFQDGHDNEHDSLPHYAFFGALMKIVSEARIMLSITRLWRVGEHESELLSLAAKAPGMRAKELRQIQLDRVAQFGWLCLLVALSWKWVLFCYLPAYYLALSLVNIQNYYEHFGALPEDRKANSVSYYGQFYNLLTFNDGYHQEHHLFPGQHWTRMHEVRCPQDKSSGAVERVISPVPAIVGFLDRKRKQLHRPVATGNATEVSG